MKFDISGLFRDYDRDYEYQNRSGSYTSSRSGSRDDEINLQSLGMTFQYLYSWHKGTNINIYVGTGPFVKFSRNKRNFEDKIETDSLTHTSEDLDKRWSFGLSGVAGVEFMITRNIGLLADYRASFSRQWYSIDHFSNTIGPQLDQKRTRNEEATAWEVNLSSLRVGISLYF